MINKKASPRGRSVRVTFELPADAATENVAVVGDFNGWEPEKGKMKLDKKSGVWKRDVSLKPGQSYAFRYYVDGREWRNDEEADGYEPSPFFSENSIVAV
jgi:1,4-alpha-glucan branching enzyme